MKKFICIVLSVFLLVSLCACKNDTEKTDNIEEVATALYPSPRSVTWEESENNLGARYNFTLEEFNTMLNERCSNIGDSGITQFFEMENWKKMSDTLMDDNGIEYTSYYYNTDTLTITASIENENQKVFNIGCGTTYDEFVNSDEEFQYTVMLTSSILAMTAGDYSDESIEFLYYIFFDSAKYDQQFFYNNSVYMLNMSKEEGEEGAALLFMMSPCQNNILEDWELTDYSTYDGTYKNK